MIHGDQKDSDILRRYIDSLIGAIDTIGSPFGTKSPSLIQKTYLDLIRRIKCALIGISAQLMHWPEIPELKVPVSLLFRACVTDILLLLYLKTIQESPDAFENEIRLLDKSYIKFAHDFIKNGGISTEPDAIDQQLQALHAAATRAGIINDGYPSFRQRSVLDIRGPKQDSPLLVDAALYAADLGPKTQLEHLRNTTGYGDLAEIYWLYRHFSQYEHYAPGNSLFIHTDQQFDCLQWYKCVVACFESIRLIGTPLEASPILIEDLLINTRTLIERLHEHAQEISSTESVN